MVWVNFSIKSKKTPLTKDPQTKNAHMLHGMFSHIYHKFTPHVCVCENIPQGGPLLVISGVRSSVITPLIHL